MRISKFIASPNLRNGIAAATKTSERKVAFRWGVAVGLAVFAGLLYAVVFAFIFSPPIKQALGRLYDPVLIVLPLFALLTIAFLNLIFAYPERFEDVVEQEELKMSQKERRSAADDEPRDETTHAEEG